MTKAVFVLALLAVTLVVANGASNETCGPNQEYLTCGSNCEEKCQLVPFVELFLCPPGCKVGCFCQQGFIRNGPDCVKPKDCPKLMSVSETPVAE